MEGMSGFDRAGLIDAALIAWFSLTALSAAYVAWDAFRRNPEMTVMKWGWLLVTLYTGPIGAALYVLSCQEPRPGSHEEFIAPLWKQGLGSTIHCLAGDATGIIVGAAVTMALGLRMWQDLIGEYVFGFAFGLFIFQALFMRQMFGGSYGTALRRSLLPEWLSMNAVMAGMVPVMVILMTRDMRAMEPTGLRFWGVMSLAAIAGFAIAYPLNVWLVAAGLKHGMGTVRVLGEGGHAVSAGSPRPAGAGQSAMPTAIATHGARHEPAAASRSGSRDAETAAPHATGQEVTPGDVIPTPAGLMPPAATAPQIVAVTGLTLLAMAAGLLLAALFGDLMMSGRMPGHEGMTPRSSSGRPEQTLHSEDSIGGAKWHMKTNAVIPRVTVPRKRGKRQAPKRGIVLSRARGEK